MSIDTMFVMARIGDELGLSPDNLAALYDIRPNTLETFLSSLGTDEGAICARVLEDLDAARLMYRRAHFDSDAMAALRKVLEGYPLHPLASMTLADGSTGWRLGADDAQYLAFRTADAMGLAFEAGEALRVCLKRVAIWMDAALPERAVILHTRIVDVIGYLAELCSIG
jgi:hypothetical protein